MYVYYLDGRVSGTGRDHAGRGARICRTINILLRICSDG